MIRSIRGKNPLSALLLLLLVACTGVIVSPPSPIPSTIISAPTIPITLDFQATQQMTQVTETSVAQQTRSALETQNILVALIGGGLEAIGALCSRHTTKLDAMHRNIMEL
jgi:hypothetical protein